VQIGRIVPIVQAGTPLGERLTAMMRAGQMQWSGRKLSSTKPIAKARGKRSVAELLVQDRE